MDSFTLILPSNVKRYDGEENFTNSYSTFFLDPIELEGQWQVGLTHVSFPKDFNNIHSAADRKLKLVVKDTSVHPYIVMADREVLIKKLENSFECSYPLEQLNVYEYIYIPREYRSQIDYYLKANHVNLKLINESFEEIENENKSFDAWYKISKCCLYTFEQYQKYHSECNYSMEFYIPKGKYNKTELIEIINKNCEGVIKVSESFEFSSKPIEPKYKSEFDNLTRAIKKQHQLPLVRKAYDISDNIQNILKDTAIINYHCLVYSDVIKPVRVGSDLSHVLESFEINNNKNTMISFSPKNIDYRELAVNKINKITIQLRNEMGDLLPIAGGHSLIKLLFVKK